MADEYRFLAHLLGPKAENEEFLERLVTKIVRDYCHWRRNYFPQDPILISSVRRRELEGEFDKIERLTDRLIADLRRTFPFYSPRYIAHQQSEVSLTSTLGMIAGLLYNPNNVTPESGAVTVDLEIEVCSQVLEMLGFKAPPEPPSEPSASEAYHKNLQKQFGWAHLSSGGTAANIESLWVARSVRFSAVGLLAGAKALRIDVEAKLPAGEKKNFRTISPRVALGLKTNEIVFLHGRLIEELMRKEGLSPYDAQKKLDLAISESGAGLAAGLGQNFSKFPPVLLVSGAAHYSFKKAADILGIGRENVEAVDMDQHFRLDPRALELSLEKIEKQGRIPFAVVGIVGTTEEGAIDPIQEILRVREVRERKRGQSFWLHIDAAWGGFLRCLFRLPNRRRVFEKRLESIVKIVAATEQQYDPEVFPRDFFERNQDRHLADRFDVLQKRSHFQEALELLSRSRSSLSPSLELQDFRLRTQDTINVVGDYVRSTLDLKVGNYERQIDLRWGHWDTGSAILAIEEADSVTIDPHKMGYAPYPIGLVAFANDRVRRFIAEDAPYITTQGRNSLTHRPPRHISKTDEFGRIRTATLAFAPFTLEGSRAGAAASALYLAFKALPLYQEEHGGIIRSSLLAARALHEWLKHWSSAMNTNGIDLDFEFVPLVEDAPDSNIVVFVVKKRTSSAISTCNAVTESVYSRFSIRAELGEKEYSYSQAFFLSSTIMRSPDYSHRTLHEFFTKAGFRNSETDYGREGLVVLRATVQNPYLTPFRTEEGFDFVREFVMELDHAAKEVVAGRNFDRRSL